MEKIVILGGTGFLGTAIARSAKARGYEVVSLSRNPYAAIGVENIKFDIFCETSNKALNKIKDASHCIHSMGTIFNNETYKSIIKGMNNQPNIKNGSTDLFHKLNTESLYKFIGLTKEMPNLKSFSYISADLNMLPFPLNRIIIDPRYYSSKIESEKFLLNGDNFNFKRFVFKPGFLYSDKNAATLTIASMLSVMNCFKKNVLPTSLQNHLPQPPAKPIHVSEIANFILSCIQDSDSLLSQSFSEQDILK